MGVFKYVVCLMVVMGTSIIPLIPPVRDGIISFFGSAVIIDSYFVVVRFNAVLMPSAISISIILSGSFTTYCIYKSDSCTWRRENVKNTMLPAFFDRI